MSAYKLFRVISETGVVALIRAEAVSALSDGRTAAAQSGNRDNAVVAIFVGCSG